jgi:1-acyl-sn-glycerol-3-phosphate acyltransferase
MFDILSYPFRLAATGMAFVLFSAGGAVATYGVFPVVFMFFRGAQRQLVVRGVIRMFFRAFVGMLEIFGIFRVRIENKHLLKSLNGAVIIANHPTLLDVVVIMSVLPNAQCIVKHKLWNSPFLGGVVRAAGYLRNDSDPTRLIDHSIASLKDGDNLLIFPQGTRTEPGESRPFHRGFANIALVAKADVQCLVIRCNPSFLAKHSRWYQIPVRRPEYRLVVADRVDIRSYLGYPLQSVAARRLTTNVECYFSEYVSNG